VFKNTDYAQFKNAYNKFTTDDKTEGTYANFVAQYGVNREADKKYVDDNLKDYLKEADF
jgi:hypothetical protein